MPVGIRLSLIKSHPTRWENGSSVEQIHRERIFGLFYLFEQPLPVHQCLVDKGAIITVFPEHIWRPHANRISWLTPLDPNPEPNWTQVRGLTGGSLLCDIGILEMT